MHPRKPKDNTGNYKSELNKYKGQIKENKREGYTAIIFYLLTGAIIFLCYPYPDIMPDTGSYLNFVYPQISYGGPRPLGYSVFLSILRDIYAGTGLIFFVQYIVFCLSSFFFYSSTVYIFSIDNLILRYTYLGISLVNIAGLYASNMMMSDSLFASLSLILFTLCLWAVHKPVKGLIIPIILLTTLIIPFRYIGMVYPVLVIPVLLLSYKNKVLPLLASAFIITFIFSYVNTVKEGTLKHQGVEVFSGFSGWQQANNALHVIPHINLETALVEQWENKDLVFLDRVVRKSYGHNGHLYPAANEVGYPFIWSDSLPLRIVFNSYRGNTDAAKRNKYYTDWNKLGLVYSEYGNLLIKQYFSEYLRYYLLNNAIRSLHPPIEIFESYNQMGDTHILKLFFGWESDYKFEPKKDIFRPVLLQLSWFYTFYWCLFGIAMLMLARVWLLKKGAADNKTIMMILLLILFALTYTAASIYGAPVNLRFLIVVRPILIGAFFIVLHIITRNKWTRAKQRS